MEKRSDSISALGDVMQIAFVPADFEAALAFWTGTMGVGPFFVREVQADEVRYRGELADIRFEVAISYWGDMQVELIRQLNETPSIYKSWRDQGLEGLHHTCIIVPDIEDARARCAAQGAEVLQEIKVGTIKAIYVDPQGGPGTLLEIIEIGAPARENFARIREAAAAWDGSDPIRRR